MKPQKPVLEENHELEDDIEVKSDGPLIAAAKKSKIAIIAASTVLVVIVFYFFFFKGDGAPKEKLQAVEPPKPIVVAPSDSGKSPFEFEEIKENQKQEVDILEKPAVPDVPALPELPEGANAPDSLNLDELANLQEAQAQKQLQDAKKDGNNALLPSQENLANQNLNQDPLNPNAQNAGALKEEKPVNPRYAPIVIFSGAQGGPKQGVGYENNIVRLNKNPLEELQETQPAVVANYITNRPNTIAQGKLITAVLETAINTEIPGQVRAIVARDVYGESGNEVLIHRGSRLYGSYTSQVIRGQGRVEITWSRLIRPDGVDLAISFNASDQFGRAGIPGEVDNKYSALVAGSLLTSVIAVAASAVAENLLTDQNQQNTTTVNAAQGATTITANATTQAVNNVTNSIINTAGRIASDALDITPVIRVPQGTRITVIVNADIRVPFLNGRRTR
jgi:type IV secretory pathway VirB10-like protein